MKISLIYALSFFVFFSLMASTAHATTLYDKMDAWKDFYNPLAGGVFERYPLLGDVAELMSFTIQLDTGVERVYIKTDGGLITKIKNNGNGKIDANTSAEVLDELLAAKTFPEIRKRFYDNYDAGNITLAAHGKKASIYLKLALLAGRVV